jgi:GAF domain-containing protein
MTMEDKGKFVGDAVRRRNRPPRHRRVMNLIRSLREDSSSKRRTIAERERQIHLQGTYYEFSKSLVEARNDDDVFKAIFRSFVRLSGVVFGVTMTSNDGVELSVVGRFGVPAPDNLNFCQQIAQPVAEMILMEMPLVTSFDAQERSDMFHRSIRNRLVGVSIMAIPLMPEPGQLIGLVVLYRKGEQPFTEDDIDFATMIAEPAGLAIQRNP